MQGRLGRPAIGRASDANRGNEPGRRMPHRAARREESGYWFLAGYGTDSMYWLNTESVLAEAREPLDFDFFDLNIHHVACRARDGLQW